MGRTLLSAAFDLSSIADTEFDTPEGTLPAGFPAERIPTACPERSEGNWFQKIGFGKSTASQVAEKLDLALDFGWRSALALR